MFAADVGQLLKVKLVRQKCAEPLAGLVVPCLSLETALSVVPGQLVQLGNQSAVCTQLDDFLCHM